MNKNFKKVCFAFFALFINKETAKQKNYVNNHCCPKCGSENVQVNVDIQTNGALAKGFAGCSDCESTWQDQYRLVGFDNLVSPQQNLSYFEDMYKDQQQRIVAYNEQITRHKRLKLLDGLNDFY